MDKLFLDTNVLLDYLAARAPFDAAAATIFQRAEEGKVELCASALSFCNIAYILRKLNPSANVLTTLAELAGLVTVTAIDETVLTNALASKFKDFEDAVQYFSALRQGGVSHLITRNAADFANAALPVLSPEAYLKR